MKKQFFFLIFLFLSTLSFAQSSLDSLRLVLPVGHTRGLTTAVFSPDGKLALTASRDCTARIYEVSSGKELQVLRGHNAEVNSAVFSPDGKQILTASYDSTARIYEVSSGKELLVLEGHKSRLESGVFSPDGKKVLISGWNDSTARIYDVSSGKVQVLAGHKSMIWSAIFSLDGKLAITSSGDKTARIYDVFTGQEMQVLSGHARGLNLATFSPDGKLAITASQDKTARIYDVSNGQVLQVLVGHTKGLNSAIFSPDGKLVLTASYDNSARIYEVSTGKELNVFAGHTNWVNSAVFSPDGKLVLTASSDSTARIFEVLSGKVLHILEGQTGKVESGVFSPNSKVVITASGEGAAHIFDVSSGQELQCLTGRARIVKSARFSPDGKFVLIASRMGTVRIFEISSGKQIQIFRAHSEIAKLPIYCSDGTLLLTMNNDKSASIYEVASGKRLKVIDQYKHHFFSSVFSPDGKLILTCGDTNARVYDVSSGRLLHVLSGHNDLVTSVVFSPDGKLILTASLDHSTVIYEVLSGKVLKILDGHVDKVNSAVFSHDSKLVLTAGDSSLRIYEVLSGEQIMVFYYPLDDVKSAVFSPNDKLVLASGSWYNIARIYEISSGKELKVMSGHRYDSNPIINQYSAEFSPDGEMVISVSRWHNTVCINEVSSGKDLNVLMKYGDLVHSALFSPSGNKVLTITTEYKTIVWDVKTWNPIYEFIQLENDNYLVKLPNSPYYMCSKDASKMLHYVTPSLKVIGFEQLDPVYNRPDIVLDSIGKYFGGADADLVANYRQSWEKRIDRLGLDKEKLGKGEIAVPNAEIVGSDAIAYENKNGKLEIKVSANDPKYPLRRFNVYVNEVPLYGSAGISIAHLKKQVWDTTVSVPLSMGENKIQVSVMNELGLENFKYPTYVNYTPTKEIVSKTYYIGIGVNEFKEAGHNLKYCVDDVTDLAEAFKSNSTVTKLFTNQNVTRENILKLKQYLKDSTTVNDKVIISCSSHGLLDDSLNFYLATNDVDFKNPKARGLKYEELEGLLDGIPARQKLLLLDACNSGENDKTELMKQELQLKEKSMDSTQVLAARGVIIKLEDENKSNFKKMNELFVNVRNNTGSVIISAAGGQESALEAIKVDGKTIENGAFTFSILECLKQNEGKELKVNTLKQYAEKRVEEITNGKQKPTSRQETMEVDWKLIN